MGFKQRIGNAFDRLYMPHRLKEIQERRYEQSVHFYKVRLDLRAQIKADCDEETAHKLLDLVDQITFWHEQQSKWGTAAVALIEEAMFD